MSASNRCAANLILAALVAAACCFRAASADGQLRSIARRILEDSQHPGQFKVVMVVNNPAVTGTSTTHAKLEIYPGLHIKGSESVEHEVKAGQDALFTWELEGKREHGRQVMINSQGEKLPNPQDAEVMLAPVHSSALFKP